jgi:dTDP-4-dehydrorhamnose 3,5-epimerase
MGRPLRDGNSGARDLLTAMLFRGLSLSGSFALDLERKEDERGFFARTFDEDEFAARGLVSRFTQSSISFNKRRGTVRGMHFQMAPHLETKLVRCLSGALLDVVVDLRRDSPTYLASASIELSAYNRTALYIPPGLAHGFQTLRDETELLYMIDVPHVPSASAGVRWNDPAFTVRWPEPVTVISPRDLVFPDWRP